MQTPPLRDVDSQRCRPPGCRPPGHVICDACWEANRPAPSPPLRGQNDRRLWEYYLAPDFVCGGGNEWDLMYEIKLQWPVEKEWFRFGTVSGRIRPCVLTIDQVSLNSLLLPANEVWGKVMFLHMSVCSKGESAYRRVCLRGSLHPREVAYRSVCFWGVGQTPPTPGTVCILLESFLVQVLYVINSEIYSHAVRSMELNGLAPPVNPMLTESVHKVKFFLFPRFC